MWYWYLPVLACGLVIMSGDLVNSVSNYQNCGTYKISVWVFGMLINGILRHETVGNCFFVCLRGRLHLPLGDQFANRLSCVNLCQIHCLVIASVTRIQQVYFVWSGSQHARFVNAFVIGLQTGPKYLVADWPAVSMEWCHRSNWRQTSELKIMSQIILEINQSIKFI